jgi:uncharacterized membrane protein YqjE
MAKFFFFLIIAVILLLITFWPATNSTFLIVLKAISALGSAWLITQAATSIGGPIFLRESLSSPKEKSGFKQLAGKPS